MYKFFQCQKQMFLDSELEIYYDLLKNDKILLQCSRHSNVTKTFTVWYANKRPNNTVLGCKTFFT